MVRIGFEREKWKINPISIKLRLTIKLEGLVVLTTFLVDLCNAAQDDGNVAMIVRELGSSDTQKLSIELKSAIKLVALMEGLPGVKGGGGVVQAVEAKTSPADLQGLLVVCEGLLKLIALDVDAAHVVERRGYLGMIPAVSSSSDGKRSAEEFHGLIRMVRGKVVRQDAQTVKSGSDDNVVGPMGFLGMVKGRFVRFDGIGNLSQAVLQLANVLKDWKGEGWEAFIAGLDEIFIFFLVIVVVILLPCISAAGIENDIADKRFPGPVEAVGGLIEVLGLTVALSQVEQESGRNDILTLVGAEHLARGMGMHSFVEIHALINIAGLDIPALLAIRLFRPNAHGNRNHTTEGAAAGSSETLFAKGKLVLCAATTDTKLLGNAPEQA